MVISKTADILLLTDNCLCCISWLSKGSRVSVSLTCNGMIMCISVTVNILRVKIFDFSFKRNFRDKISQIHEKTKCL